MSFGATRYCLPPVRMTANMSLISVQIYGLKDLAPIGAGAKPLGQPLGGAI
jgi:hypothetical protein